MSSTKRTQIDTDYALGMYNSGLISRQSFMELFEDDFVPTQTWHNLVVVTSEPPIVDMPAPKAVSYLTAEKLLEIRAHLRIEYPELFYPYNEEGDNV